ncbi:MAG: hypothetical protein JW801_03740 [Bacteroidales bacterium]|nr:hypothetical protein [Bacteroidales bacterium]
MKRSYHLVFATVCILLWSGFFLAGQPYHYFQNFSRESTILLLLITFFAVIPPFTITLLGFINVPFFRASLWLAFYSSVLPFVLDMLAIGILKGEGIHFLTSYWYLTLGYIIVWIEIPLIGKSLEKIGLRIINQRF